LYSNPHTKSATTKFPFGHVSIVCGGPITAHGMKWVKNVVIVPEIDVSLVSARRAFWFDRAIDKLKYISKTSQNTGLHYIPFQEAVYDTSK